MTVLIRKFLSTKTIRSDKRRSIELTAVLVTAAGKFIFMDYLNWRFPFVITAIAAWICYILYRNSHDKATLKNWGFRTDNFSKTVKMILPFGLLAVLTFIIIGFFQKTLNPTWHLLPVLLFYPLWGIIQQYLLIALVAGNLNNMVGVSISHFTIILLTAILFSVVHYPDYWLMSGTFILALFYGYVYLKSPNLYALGLFHGWLGAIFYYTVINRDPFLETFGKLLNLT